MNVHLLKSQMALAGVNQSKLSKLIGISPQSMSRKLLGRNAFDTREVSRICDVLGITDTNLKCDIFLTEPSLNRDNDLKEANA